MNDARVRELARYFEMQYVDNRIVDLHETFLAAIRTALAEERAEIVAWAQCEGRDVGGYVVASELTDWIESLGSS